MNSEYPIVSMSRSVQDAYIGMRLSGESHAMAEILSTRKFPGLRTDSEFNIGRCNGNQFESEPWRGDYYKHVADQSGVSVNGKFYQSGLARFPGDPEAWVSGRGDVERICRERGWGCDGTVNIEARQCAPKPDIAIAEDIIDREAREVVLGNPDCPMEAAREFVVNNMTRSSEPQSLDGMLMDDLPEEV